MNEKQFELHSGEQERQTFTLAAVLRELEQLTQLLAKKREPETDHERRWWATYNAAIAGPAHEMAGNLFTGGQMMKMGGWVQAVHRVATDMANTAHGATVEDVTVSSPQPTDDREDIPF